MAISCTAHRRGVREPLVRTRRSSRCPRASGGHGCYTERPLRPMRARRILASRRSRAASATRCRPHAPRFRGWRSLDRTLPTSDVSCRAARTAAPAPTGWQLRTRRARTIAGPRRLPSCRAIPASSSFPDAAEPKFLALACDRSSVKSRAPVRRLCHRNARQCPRGDFRPAMRPVFTERQRCVSTDFCFPSLRFEHPRLVVARVVPCGRSPRDLAFHGAKTASADDSASRAGVFFPALPNHRASDVSRATPGQARDRFGRFRRPRP
jgi:hypothetical protein